VVKKTTTFTLQDSLIYNPFDIILSKPETNTIVPTNNKVRDFYSSFKSYVILYSGVTYEIISYTQPDNDGLINFKVKGNPFNGVTEIADNFIIRPNDGIVEEFYKGLDDVESLLLNRETSPKYTAKFKVPRDSYNNSTTDIVGVEVSWPIARDGWNIQIIGLEYERYIDELNTLADEIDDYKSNIVVRFLTAPQLFEFDTDDKRIDSIFQLYGQSFDKVKNYITNIANMRNVSYDSINNIPDLLLKNLSQTLGLSTVPLHDETSLKNSLYTISYAFLLSPYPGAFTASTLNVPRSLLTTNVAKASPSTSSAMMTRSFGFIPSRLSNPAAARASMPSGNVSARPTLSEIIILLKCSDAGYT
jgi:hypothetical protein